MRFLYFLGYLESLDFDNFFQIVYQYGGIYCDTDCIRWMFWGFLIWNRGCLKNCNFSAKAIPPIMKRSFVSMITSGETYIYNGIFAFAKGSNFLKFVLETLKSSYKNIENYNLQSVSIKTGPLFLTSMFVSKQLCFSRKGVQLTIHFVQFCLDISSFKVILLWSQRSETPSIHLSKPYCLNRLLKQGG